MIERIRTVSIAYDVMAEQERARAKHGDQAHLPDGTGAAWYTGWALQAQAETDAAAAGGTVTWRHILEEEVAEAFAERDPDRLRAELLQVAAVAQTWIGVIDQRARQAVDAEAQPRVG